MREELRQRMLAEKEAAGGRLRHAADLLRRRVSAEDYLDSAVIGGVELKNIIAGRVAEAAISPEVLRAYHDQYPQMEASFTATVHRLARDPERLEGLVNGVKGKLFEEHYAGWLNDGNLPAGYHAELAHAANNPAWDIAIRDAHGHLDHVLQLKATDQLAHVRDAIAAHPDIEVVVPHETYLQAGQHADLTHHLLDSHQSLHGLGIETGTAAGHAETAFHAASFHLPVLSFLVVAGQTYWSYRTGRLPAADALKSAGERGVLALASVSVFHLGLVVLHSCPVGFALSMLTRLAGGQALHNRDRRTLLDESSVRIRDSSSRLDVRWARSAIAGLASPG